MAKKQVAAAKGSVHPKIHTLRIKAGSSASIECFDSYALVRVKVTAPTAPVNFPEPQKTLKCRVVDTESGDFTNPEYMDWDENDPSLFTARIDAPAFLTVGRSYVAMVEVEWRWEIDQVYLSDAAVCKQDN